MTSVAEATTIPSIETAHLTKNNALDEEDLENLNPEFKQFLLSLPRANDIRAGYSYQFQGFWCPKEQIQATISFQKYFQARDTDVVLASVPKSGTTWLKALGFAILNRKLFPVSNDHPLLAANPHDLVPFFEYKVYGNNQVPDLSKLPEPRLFATHLPFASLEESVRKSNCPIVYICRNPCDTLISQWFYVNKLRPENLPPLPLEEMFESFCEGTVAFGPYLDHMLGYWKESLERPDKVLFLKYEDVKKDATFNVKKIAEFLGCPFSVEEEREGVIEGIAKLCSIETLREVNKNGKSIKNFDNKHLFRKGQVGDWVNYLTPPMVQKLGQLIEEKFGGSGLHF